MTLARLRHWRHAAVAALFLACVVTPLLATPVKLAVEGVPPDLRERLRNWRRVSRLAAAVRDYLTNGFCFRMRLVAWHGRFKTGFLSVPASRSAIVGRDGWLFLASERALEYARHLEPFSEAQLARWRVALDARRAFCDARGITYVFAVAPNKDTIYREYLPDFVAARNPLSRLDQLVAAQSEGGAPVLDLRLPLFAAKGRARLYHKTDTHWNEAGAFVAYRRIMEHVRERHQGLELLSWEDLITRVERGEGGDLARMIEMPDDYPEEHVRVSLPAGRSVVLDDGAPLRIWEMEIMPLRRLVVFCQQGELETAVVIHDSFGKALIPLLARHFRRSVFVWGKDFDAVLVLRERPQVVIHEMAERILLNWLPRPDEARLSLP
jgi:hypothetical protein